MIKLSVLIPTKGRVQELMNTVKSLSEQSTKPFEIIVGDQNDPEIAELTAFLKSQPLVKHLRGHGQGLVRNYNACFAASRGEIVVYLDDDTILKENLLEVLLKIFRDDDHTLGCVAGRVLNAHGDVDPKNVKCVGRYHRLSGGLTAQFNGEREVNVDFPYGAQMSFRREALDAIGGFDEDFIGTGYFFETDGGLRLKEKGYRLLFKPEAVVRHLMVGYGGTRMKNKALHTYYFIRNGAKLYRRHSPALGLLYFVPRTVLYLVAKSIYNFNFAILSRGLCALRDGLCLKRAL